MANVQEAPLSEERFCEASLNGRGAQLLLWAALLPILLAGCVTTEGYQSNKPPTPGEPCQIVTTWQKSIAYAPDPTRGGQPAPGLAGRVYLFGPEVGDPMTGEGSLTVDMFDASQGEPVMVERWEIDAATLQRLLKRDFIGWGYSLFLPSGRYKPEMSKLRLRTCFKSAKGAPIFAESEVTLGAGNGVIRQGTKPLTAMPPGVKW
jgi:hypothetical protein